MTKPVSLSGGFSLGFSRGSSQSAGKYSSTLTEGCVPVTLTVKKIFNENVREDSLTSRDFLFGSSHSLRPTIAEYNFNPLRDPESDGESSDEESGWVSLSHQKWEALPQIVEAPDELESESESEVEGLNKYFGTCMLQDVEGWVELDRSSITEESLNALDLLNETFSTCTLHPRGSDSSLSPLSASPPSTPRSRSSDMSQGNLCPPPPKKPAREHELTPSELQVPTLAEPNMRRRLADHFLEELSTPQTTLEERCLDSLRASKVKKTAARDNSPEFQRRTRRRV